MWPVDEADDDEDPPAPDFIATEARFGGPQLRAARRDSVARRRRLGVGCARQALSRLPLRLFGGEPGPRPSEILAAMLEQAGKLALTCRAFHNDQLAPLFTNRACRLPLAAANEQRCRGCGECDHVRAQVGPRGEGYRSLTMPRASTRPYSRAPSLARCLGVRMSPLAPSRSPALANSICARLPSRSVKRKAMPDHRSRAPPDRAPTIRMNASLQGFNLVRIECHFNVPIPLTVADASLATVSSSKIDRFWLCDRHGYFGGKSSVNLPPFRRKRPAFGDFRRSQTTEDASNYLELQVNMRSDDGQ